MRHNIGCYKNYLLQELSKRWKVSRTYGEK